MKKFILSALALVSFSAFAMQSHQETHNGVTISLNPGDDQMSLTVTNGTGSDIEVFPKLQKDHMICFCDMRQVGITELMLIEVIDSIKTRTKSSVLTLSELKKELQKDSSHKNNQRNVSADNGEEFHPWISPALRTLLAGISICKRLIPYSLLSAGAGWGIATIIGKGNPSQVAIATGLLCAAVCGWQIKTEDAVASKLLQLGIDMVHLQNTKAQNISDLPVELAEKIYRAEKLVDKVKKSIVVKPGKSIKGTVIVAEKGSDNNTNQAINAVQLKVKQCNTNRIMNIHVPILRGAQDCFVLGVQQGLDKKTTRKN